MEFAITGHSKGIGKALFEELTKRGNCVFGYSRTNGFDISVPSVRDEIIAKSIEADVFINNAYSSPGQYELLESLTNTWSEQNKLIVNIGSKIVYSDIVPAHAQSYVEDKKRQQEFIRNRLLLSKPQIMHLMLGLIDTEMSKFFSAEKISPLDLSVLISDLIGIKNKISCQELILDVPSQDWKDIIGTAVTSRT
jgi:NAD(P)-dependent dehydrogenase (short-subunit alcohol dehydrogenase family)